LIFYDTSCNKLTLLKIYYHLIYLGLNMKMFPAGVLVLVLIKIFFWF